MASVRITDAAFDRIREVELTPTAIWDLKSRLRGNLLLPDEPGYQESRTVWNAMIDQRPVLIIRCRGVSDVVEGVKLARMHGLPLSIKGGGHNISGLAVCEGGVMLDMSLMRGVWIDPVERRARAQAGCLLGDVDREAQLYGLAPVLGFISSTGIAGLTLGGGFGYLTRRYGWACDNVLSTEVVTAEGRIVRASEKENSDLFWGLRGGGGNFGVVTSFEYALYPVGPEIVGGAIAWRAEDAPQVLELFRSMALQAPPEHIIVAGLRLAPPAPWLPQDIHGKPIVALFVCDTGPVAEAEKRVARIKEFGSPVGDIVQRRSYISQQSLVDATQPYGRRYYWKSEYLPSIQPEMLERAIYHSSRIMSPHSAILMFPLEGVLNRIAEDHSPAGNRDAAVVLGIAASWENPADDGVNVEWTRSAWNDLRRFSTGGTYINFQTADEDESRIRAAYGNNYNRLVEIKSKWDPGNLFRINKNIAPPVG